MNGLETLSVRISILINYNIDINTSLDARKTWYWHESTVNQDRDCNFDKKRLKDAFNGVGLSGGLDDNICYRIEHVDAALAKDPKAPKKLEDQKYKVGEKDYTVCSSDLIFCPISLIIIVGNRRALLVCNEPQRRR